MVFFGHEMSYGFFGHIHEDLNKKLVTCLNELNGDTMKCKHQMYMEFHQFLNILSIKITTTCIDYEHNTLRSH